VDAEWLRNRLDREAQRTGAGSDTRQRKHFQGAVCMNTDRWRIAGVSLLSAYTCVRYSTNGPAALIGEGVKIAAL
jgi:hypothetical protein